MSKKNKDKKTAMITKKTKETNALIDSLTDNLSAVRPLLAPYKRMFIWGMLSLCSILLLASILNGFRYDLSNKIDDTGFIIENFALLIISFGMLYSAFKLSIPDINHGKKPLIILTLGTLSWLGIIAFSLIDVGSIDLYNIFPAELSHCIVDLITLITLPTAVLFTLLKKSAPTMPAWTGYAMLLAITSIGALAMRAVCPVDDSMHLLLTHFMPAFGMSFLGLIIGKLFLRW